MTSWPEGKEGAEEEVEEGKEKMGQGIKESGQSIQYLREVLKLLTFLGHQQLSHLLGPARAFVWRKSTEEGIIKYQIKPPFQVVEIPHFVCQSAVASVLSQIVSALPLLPQGLSPGHRSGCQV